MNSLFGWNRNTKKQKKNLSQICDDDYGKRFPGGRVNVFQSGCPGSGGHAFNNVFTFPLQAIGSHHVSHNREQDA